MHVWFLAVMLIAIIMCSWLNPGSGLERSAWRAFDSSMTLLSQGGGGDDNGRKEEDTRPPARQAQKTACPTRGMQPWKTSVVRRRVTPLMARRVAVKFGFKCGICGQTLDESWETDHITPLSQARSARDVERLNSIENLQPVHRIPCHQTKSSREASGW